MFCSYCGAKNLDDAKFCTGCGKSLSIPAASLNENRQPLPNVPLMTHNYTAENTFVKTAKKAVPLKKVLIVAAALLVVISTLFFVFQKSDEDMITGRLNTFAAAYNEGNFDKLVDCFDPKTKTTLKSAAGIGSKLLGLDVADLFGLVMGIGPSFTPKDTTIYISIHSIDFTDENKARADITFHFGEEKDDITLEMMKSGGQWYIDMSNESLF